MNPTPHRRRLCDMRREHQLRRRHAAVVSDVIAICGCQWRCHRHVAVSGAAGRTAAAAASAVRGSLALQHENLFRLNQDGNLLWCDVGRDADTSNRWKIRHRTERRVKLGQSFFA